MYNYGAECLEGAPELPGALENRILFVNFGPVAQLAEQAPLKR
jgi:hypothetical protein